MRATMAAVKPDTYLVAEHAYDASRELDGDGWHGVMNYLSFTRPVWSFLRRDEPTKFLGDPLPVPRFGAGETAASFRELHAVQPWRSTVAGFNLLGSHDTSRFRTVAGDADRQIAGAGLLFTMPGVPMVFAGDEIGLTGVDGDGARQPMPWDESCWDREVFDAYRALGAVRRSSRALRHGGLRWVHADGDVLVFLREARDERMLVQVARAEHAPVVLGGLGGDVGDPCLGGAAAARRPDGTVELPAGGAGVHIWELS